MRTSRVQSEKARNVFVTLIPRGGRTKIRVEERLGALAGELVAEVRASIASRAPQ